MDQEKDFVTKITVEIEKATEAQFREEGENPFVTAFNTLQEFKAKFPKSPEIVRLRDILRDKMAERKNSSSDPQQLVSIGFIFLEMNNLSRATECFLKAKKIDPNFVEAYHGLGLVALNRRQFELAAECCQRGLKIDPDHQALRANLKKIEQKIEDLKTKKKMQPLADLCNLTLQDMVEGPAEQSSPKLANIFNILSLGMVLLIICLHIFTPYKFWKDFNEATAIAIGVLLGIAISLYIIFVLIIPTIQNIRNSNDTNARDRLMKKRFTSMMILYLTIFLLLMTITIISIVNAVRLSLEGFFIASAIALATTAIIYFINQYRKKRKRKQMKRAKKHFIEKTKKELLPKVSDQELIAIEKAQNTIETLPDHQHLLSKDHESFLLLFLLTTIMNLKIKKLSSEKITAYNNLLIKNLKNNKLDGAYGRNIFNKIFKEEVLGLSETEQNDIRSSFKTFFEIIRISPYFNDLFILPYQSISNYLEKV